MMTLKRSLWWLVALALALVLAWSLLGCAALRKQLWVGGGTAAAAAAGGALGGPLGAGVAGGVAAVAIGATAETQEYRDGDVVGEEALRRELNRWHGTALVERERASSASTWLWRIVGLFALYFAWRNRAHLMAFGPGYLKRLWHTIFGGKVT